MSAAAAPLCSTMIGDIRITYLPDGAIRCARPIHHYKGSTDEFWEQNSRYLDLDGGLVMSLGSFLIEVGERKVLVDLAFGPRVADMNDVTRGRHQGSFEGGQLLDSLDRSGLSPTDIDTVIYSHLHPDHLGWVCRGDGDIAVFPNASHYVGEIEWAYWQDGQAAGWAIAPTEGQVRVLQKDLHLIADGFCVAPGVNVVLTPGHTPGHCSLVISSATDRALILGDAIHCPLEIEQQELDFSGDVDPAVSRRTKEWIEKELEAPNMVAAGGHFPDLVFGRLMVGSGHKYLQFTSDQLS